MVLQFVLDLLTAYKQCALKTRENQMYTELVNRLTKDWDEGEGSSDVQLDVRGEVRTLGEMVKDNCLSNLIKHVI